MFMPENMKKFVGKMTDKIIEVMESQKKLPWDNGMWSKGLPVSHYDGGGYHGLNVFILSFCARGSNEWATFDAIRKEGGHVIKGAKHVPIVKFWWQPIEDKKDKTKDEAEEKKIKMKPCWKYFQLFEIGVDTEGIEPKYNKALKAEPPRIDAAEDFIKNFFTATNLKLTERMGTPCYVPSLHTVRIPPRGNFKTSASYYDSMFHEMTHSTGKELGRNMEGGFGGESYSLEELVAEFGCSMLLHQFGIIKDADEATNQMAYLTSWMKSFRNNPEWLFEGAKLAEKAFRYMLEKGGEAKAEPTKASTNETKTRAKAKPKTATVEVNATAA